MTSSFGCRSSDVIIEMQFASGGGVVCLITRSSYLESLLTDGFL